jgi:hypothetical protein
MAKAVPALFARCPESLTSFERAVAARMRKAPRLSERSFVFDRNAPGGTRTPNLLIRSQMLYPIELRAPIRLRADAHLQANPDLLSDAFNYIGMGGTRLELVTSTMSTWRSNQLS